MSTEERAGVGTFTDLLARHNALLERVTALERALEDLLQLAEGSTTGMLSTTAISTICHETLDA